MKHFFIRKGNIPYGYGFPKDKNIDKYRPVVSYFKHPCKNAYKVVCKGIMECLKMITNDNKNNFVLWKTGDLLDVLKSKVDNLIRMYGNDSKLLVKAYDIKNFYTNLNHDEIRCAIKWLHDSLKLKYRNHKFININKKKDEKNVFIGNEMKNSDWLSLTLDNIEDLVNLDLDNTFFMIGDKVLKQKKGVPMGSPISPVLAILVAAYYEYKFYMDSIDIEQILLMVTVLDRWMILLLLVFMIKIILILI